MKEHYLKAIERLRLEDLKAGDLVTITTGTGEDAWAYLFTVEEDGQWPNGTLVASAPDSSETEPVAFSLHGAGNWTNRRQNPVQEQERGFNSDFNAIYIGGCLVGRFGGDEERAVFDQTGQEITRIELGRSEQ